MKIRVLLAVLLVGAFSQLPGQTNDSVKVNVSHIFFCVDSVTYKNLFEHEFLAKMFANASESSSKTLTDSWTGKYLNGRQSYIEVFASNYKAKDLQLGDKFGDVGIVFRPQKSGDINKINLLIKADQRDAHFELMNYESDGKIIPFNYNLYLAHPTLQETFRPYVEEFTVDFLKLCGFTESEIKSGITEERFREKRSGRKYEKLYDNIEKIELTLTDEEFEYLAQTLQYVGFSQTGFRFTNNRLEIICSIQPNRTYKLKAIHFTLLKKTKSITIEVSKNLTFRATGAKASFLFNYR